MPVIVRPLNIIGGPNTGISSTFFDDDFTRTNPAGLLTDETHPWVVQANTSLPIPGGSWTVGTMGVFGGIADLGSYGPNNPAAGRSSFAVPSQFINPVVWGRNQYSRVIMTARTATPGGVDYSGPAVHVWPGNAGTGYIMAWVGTNQWYLIRGENVFGLETVLIAPTVWVVAFPATWEIRVEVNTPVAGTNRVSTYINGVQVGTVDDVYNFRAGVPGLYILEQMSGGVQSTMNLDRYTGGLLV